MPNELLAEWDILVKTFNEHEHEVTDATNKHFVGKHIFNDSEYSFWMDPTRTLTSIVVDANMTGCSRRHRQTYPTDRPNLSK